VTFRPRRFPQYHVPHGVAVPAHIFDRVGSPLLPDGGPLQAGGTMHHGPYRPDSAAEYAHTPEGWLVRLGDATPDHLLRTHALPGVVIAGALPGHKWLVPVLLTLQQSVPDWLVVLSYANGAADWAPMVGLTDLVERVRAARLGQLNESELRALAIDLLARNHHVSEHELIAGGWMLKPMVLDVVLGACSITPEMRAQVAP